MKPKPLTKEELSKWSYVEIYLVRSKLLILREHISEISVYLSDLVKTTEDVWEIIELENELKHNNEVSEFLLYEIAMLESTMIEREESIIQRYKHNGLNFYYSLN